MWPQIDTADAFARDVEKTLDLLNAVLRGAHASARQFPDLREDHHVMFSSLGLEHHPLFADETDRITNSLNTLREQIIAWRRRDVDTTIPIPEPQQP